MISTTLQYILLVTTPQHPLPSFLLGEHRSQLSRCPLFIPTKQTQRININLIGEKMMSAAFGSEMMSSGCESGWTLYLDHSHYSNLIVYDDGNRKPAGRVHGKKAPFNNDDEEEDDIEEEEEEEDMSMMSDASSGPPHQYHGHYQDQAVEVNYNDHHRSSNWNENNTVGQDNCYYGSYAISHCCDSPSKSKSTSDEKKSKRNGKAGSSSTTTHLDDTASSSPYFNHQNSIGVTNWQRQGSMESLFDYSQGFSTTHDHHFPMGNKFNRRRTIK
ncbi:hypothetical protein Droror1_Dr00006989 [Drosera rotundifolia]